MIRTLSASSLVRWQPLGADLLLRGIWHNAQIRFDGLVAGELLLGLRVVNRAGGRLGFWQSIARIIGYLILPGIYNVRFYSLCFVRF